MDNKPSEGRTDDEIRRAAGKRRIFDPDQFYCYTYGWRDSEAALRAETPTPRDEEAEALIEQVYQDLGRVGKVMNATYARIERWRERAETPAPRVASIECPKCGPGCYEAAGDPEQAK